ncbi:MAG: hypothetical protein CMO12_01720 [Thaumarchaeota archaeon]|jgi:hypothetical protein|nr:hypothetical protein [Nitrososphaerota archaeon]|tara:strand:- start:13788 stop:13988 length:201 start_codon:yes stop_codon:yes gene_type:complete
MFGKTSSKIQINLLIRLLGVIFIVIGVALAYNTSTTPLVPALVPVFYIIASSFIFVGILALISRIT